MKDWTKYLLIPYLKGGRDFSGADCYGLFLLASKNEYNDYRFPDFPESGIIGGLHGIARTGEFAKKNNIKKLDLPIECCFVRLRGQEGLPNHCGLYAGDGIILHTDEVRGARLENINDLKEKIIDYWG